MRRAALVAALVLAGGLSFGAGRLSASQGSPVPQCPSEDACSLSYTQGAWYLTETHPDQGVECDAFETDEIVCVTGDGETVPHWTF